MIFYFIMIYQSMIKKKKNCFVAEMGYIWDLKLLEP